ncbi:MAG: HDIG domain-containing metalloprotein [Longimicrobiales bacterium]
MAASRDLFDSLSSRPARVWPDAFVHHGARVVLLVAIAILIQMLFPVSPVPELPALEKGMVAPADVLAEIGFPVRKAPTKLAAERAGAAAAVAPLFRYDSTAVDSMHARIRTFGGAVDSAATGTAAETRATLIALLTSYGLPATEPVVVLLSDRRARTQLQQSLERAVTAELPKGIMSSADDEDAPGAQLRIARRGIESVVAHDSVLSQSALYEAAATWLPQSAPEGMADLQRLALILFFEGSLRLDRNATADAREQAARTVPIIKEHVQRGQRIISAHTVVTENDVERVNAYASYLRESGAVRRGGESRLRQLGQFMLSTLLLSIFGLLLLFFRPAIYQNARHISLMAFLLALLLCTAAVIAGNRAPIELVPIAFPVLVVAMLWDGRMALTFGVITAALLGMLGPFMGLSARLLPLLGAAGAALSVRVVRRRSQGLAPGAFIGLAYALGTVAVGLMRSRELDDVMTSILWGLLNGTACSLIAMGFLPFFESYARITTDQTLLELADLNRPILKRLSVEASGTYAHSINVANLAEAAARAIDANAILVRVGAYYHDIGKIATPQYFIENQTRGRNPHEQMDPRHSASLVRQHVQDGLRLAQEARLPASIRAFIPEHHGTQLIGYFYEIAQKLNPDAPLDRAAFSYPGPRPQSRETAILMLADSVESATKALADPTPERIRDLVERITDAKIASGQFDEAPITLRDIRRIKEQLIATLTGIYHQRIDYPAAAVQTTLGES